MLKDRKMAHIGLATNHVVEDVAWYQNILGFQKIGEFKTPAGEKVFFLKGNGFVYEIYQPSIPVSKEQAGKIDHIALESADIEADYKECVEQGCCITTNGIEQISTFWERGIRYFKIKSPTGEEIEFCQIM
ncbi:hypothetical protein C819_00744 [Lachnospiraceae bacterium 10-1]|jgi:catechol 2,3-dioxygenase-like lactoylglutathione lyase family enzyme|nr:hypothetical protein C819_00744 [Lachnospiraceae bacterium 10-1]